MKSVSSLRLADTIWRAIQERHRDWMRVTAYWRRSWYSSCARLRWRKSSIVLRTRKPRKHFWIVMAAALSLAARLNRRALAVLSSASSAALRAARLANPAAAFALAMALDASRLSASRCAATMRARSAVIAALVAPAKPMSTVPGPVGAPPSSTSPAIMLFSLASWFMMRKYWRARTNMPYRSVVSVTSRLWSTSAVVCTALRTAARAATSYPTALCLSSNRVRMPAPRTSGGRAAMARATPAVDLPRPSVARAPALTSAPVIPEETEGPTVKAARARGREGER